jgi:type II secretory pathway pseudopilin PulG
MTHPPKALNTATFPTCGEIRRRGLSLLEVIIATAILSGAGFVLFSIIGLGAKYARRAEAITLAHHFAQSILDEAIAQPDTIGKDKTETILEAPEWSYRITTNPLEDPSLVQVTVEVFPTQETSGASASTGDTPSTYQLSRWIRIPAPISEGSELP